MIETSFVSLGEFLLQRIQTETMCKAENSARHGFAQHGLGLKAIVMVMMLVLVMVLVMVVVLVMATATTCSLCSRYFADWHNL